MIANDKEAAEIGYRVAHAIEAMLLDPDYNAVLKQPVRVRGYDFGDVSKPASTGTFTIRIERPNPDEVVTDE
jgi:hypothetical protein